MGDAGRHLPQAPRRRPTTRPSASSCTPRWGRSTSRSCAISIAPSTPTTTSSPSRPTTPTRWPGSARLYEETEQWDRAVEVMRRLIRVSTDAEAEGRPQLSPGQDLRRADEGAGARRGVPGRGAVAGSGPRAVDAVAARHLQAARRLAEGGAADGPRRGGDRQPAGEDAPAVRGGQDLPGEAGRRGAGGRPLRAGAAAGSRARRGGASRCRSSTSSARSGRRWCRSSRCWRARPTARPTAS